MLKSIILWSLAIIITLAAAVYQKKTGPTYPVSGEITFARQLIEYELDRAHGGDGDQRVAIVVPNVSITGTLYYKRYGTGDEFRPVMMVRAGDTISGNLPHQPPAGKLEYYVTLNHGEEAIHIPGEQSIVTRFRGAVPLKALVPHIALMFLAMLWSTRTGLEAFHRGGKTKLLAIQTTALLLLGGLVMGPIVQNFAFGDYWTGVPFGWDLTDNKTLIAFIGWIIAVWRHKYNPYPRYWVLAASIILLGVFMIPHSVMGSELNYSSGAIETG